MTRKSTTLGFIVLPLAAWLFAGCDDTVAPLPSDEWTVMAYIKSDVRLRDELKQNIAEMEAAATDPRVNVIVQADFPSENAFRRVISGETSVEDLGELDMANPATLRQFVQLATQRFPAQRSLLVLSGHGGQYQGVLFGDEGALSIRGLPTALDGLGIDVLGFDACYMGGYETLSQIAPAAGFTVFSEHTIPGDGFPYTEMLNAIADEPSIDARDVAKATADMYQAKYSSGRAGSATISSYDLAGFDDFKAALDSLAKALTASLENQTLAAAAIASAAHGSQDYRTTKDTLGNFAFVEWKDLGNLLDSLSVRVGDDDIRALIADLKDESRAAGFRLRDLFNNFPNDDLRAFSQDVGRSTGMTIVMPSGIPPDTIYNQQFYESLFPEEPWTDFLATFVDSQSGKIVDPRSISLCPGIEGEVATP